METKHREKKPRLPFIPLTEAEVKSKNISLFDGMAECPRCGRKHVVGYGSTGGVINKMLGYVKCKGRTYLVAIDNHVL